MKTVTINLYSFDELSEEAKQTAIENYRNKNNYVAWVDENFDTLHAFAKLFPITINKAEYGGRGEGVYFTFDESDEIENLSGQRLATYVWNNYRRDIYTFKQYWRCGEHLNCIGAGAKHTQSKIFLVEGGCPLTGYCMDDSILEPLFKFMRKPDNTVNFKELLEDCFSEWIKACNQDMEYQNSDEYITEEIEANDYQFTEDGERA